MAKIIFLKNSLCRDEYIPCFHKLSEQFLQVVGNQQPHNVFEISEKMMFDSICESGFNFFPDMLTGKCKSPFPALWDETFRLQKNRATKPQLIKNLPTAENLKFENNFKQLLVAVDEIIDQKANSGRKDLLYLMQNAKNPETGQLLDKENIRDQVITLLVAGHKTSALLL